MATTAQFQYTRLGYQAQAVESVAQVFVDVRFIAPSHAQANPTFMPAEAQAALTANITRIRADNHVSAGLVQVAATATPTLSLDVLMETGTGKTFTFIETMHRLYRDHRIAKFIVLVPSNAIRQGTLRSLQSTADFFAREYENQKIRVINYSEKSVGSFINSANQGITVMVATYQSFAGDTKLINKRGVEANLFGRAKSYMEALAAIRPALIIDEPHRFEGKKTQEYLTRFNPLLTLRFGATFKRDEFCNLLYTLDSLEAFRQRLVKSITVDTVGAGADMAQSLTLTEVGGTVKERSAKVRYQTADGKNAVVSLKAKDNLGEATELPFLNGHVVEKITKSELLFTNGFALPLDEPTGYGMLADEVQSELVRRTIANHFEREEMLFMRRVKAISLFFIDAVHKYLPDGQRPAVLRELFERHYSQQLQIILARGDLDPDYRAYLERTATSVDKVHHGYFARSRSEKGEEDAIKLILQDKERLLSFDTDLRFIFSMWALQEGWDNPNVFTLCKLAPSNSKITKLQQIGRGLRLAVDQNLQRISADDASFDEINDLTVVVPASEGNFVAAIQNEIAAHSVQRIAATFNDAVLVENGIANSTRQANKVLDALSSAGLITLDEDSGNGTLLWDYAHYQAHRTQVVSALAQVANLPVESANHMLRYLDKYYEGAGQVKTKQARIKPTLTINAARYQSFRQLWENLNRDAVVRYAIDTEQLVAKVLAAIVQQFDVKPLTITTTRTTQAQNARFSSSEQQADYKVVPQSVFTLMGFVRELANATRLSIHTISDILRRMPTDKFAQIAQNEQRALITLQSLIVRCVHELVINTVKYELREVRIETAMTDKAGQLLKTIPLGLCGSEVHAISNPAVQQRSLYEEPLMPVDSQIERDTTDESNHSSITVFAKLPRINIPTPLGNYNPDFGYVLQQQGQAQALYLVVETKGYDNYGEISAQERGKIESAKHFFKALKEHHIPVEFVTKINHQALATFLAEVNQPLGLQT